MVLYLNVHVSFSINNMNKKSCVEMFCLTLIQLFIHTFCWGHHPKARLPACLSEFLTVMSGHGQALPQLCLLGEGVLQLQAQ